MLKNDKPHFSTKFTARLPTASISNWGNLCLQHLLLCLCSSKIASSTHNCGLPSTLLPQLCCYCNPATCTRSRSPPPFIFLPCLSFYWPRSQFPASPRGSFLVCPGARGNLSRETNCSVTASCEHLARPRRAQPGYTSRDGARAPTYTGTCMRTYSRAHTLALTPVLPSALYNCGPHGNVM